MEAWDVRADLGRNLPTLSCGSSHRPRPGALALAVERKYLLGCPTTIEGSFFQPCARVDALWSAHSVRKCPAGGQ